LYSVIQAVLGIHPGYDFGNPFKTLRRQGYRWYHKRVYRVYCLLGLYLFRTFGEVRQMTKPETLIWLGTNLGRFTGRLGQVPF
jgi:hypothetical protein